MSNLVFTLVLGIVLIMSCDNLNVFDCPMGGPSYGIFTLALGVALYFICCEPGYGKCTLLLGDVLTMSCDDI